MARPAPEPLPPLADLLSPAGELHVRVTPRAGRETVTVEAGRVHVRVTEVPEGGRATEAVRAALAKAFGVPKTSLELVRGATSRDKVFRFDAA